MKTPVRAILSMHFIPFPQAEKEDFLPAVLDICRRESVQIVIPT